MDTAQRLFNVNALERVMETLGCMMDKFTPA